MLFGDRRNMASTSGIKGNKLSKPDNGEGDVRRESVRDSKKQASKKVTHNAILLCGEGPHGDMGELMSDDEEFASLEAEQFFYDKCNDPAEDVKPMYTFSHSTHRDGFIYRGNYSWKKDYRIEDRNESK